MNESQQFNVTQINEIIEKTFLYILIQSNTKLPIKKSDIVKHCLLNNHKIFPQVFQSAVQQLKDIYGIKVCTYDGVKSVKQYFCVSNFPSISLININDKFHKNLPILFMILSYIYMKGGSVLENAVKNFIETIEVKCENEETLEESSLYIEKLISTTFIKQLYLKREKFQLEGSNEQKFELSWGARADEEFTKQDVLNTVAQMLDKPSESFQKQYMALNEDFEIQEEQ